MLKINRFKKYIVAVLTAATVLTAMSVQSIGIFAASTGKVTVNSLNLRSGKSLSSSVILKLPQNASLNILDTSDKEWYKVTYNNKTGYVAKEFVSLANSATIGTGVVNVSVLNVREAGSTTSDIVAKLKMNQVITLNLKSGDWYQITSGAVKGYVNAPYITVKNTRGSVNVSALNVRSEASLTASKMGLLKKSASVEIVSTAGEWYYVKSGSVTGYVFSAYVTLSGTTSNQTASTSSSKADSGTLKSGNIFKCTVPSLNVRKQPSTASSRLAVLVKGNQVTFLGVADKDSDWYQVKTTKGVTGYVHKDYVEFYSAAQATTNQATNNSSNKATATAKATSKPQTTAKTNNSANTSETTTAKAAQIITTAKKYLGVRYVYGGESPKGFDCSGFTYYVFSQYKISLSRSSRDQAKNGTAVNKSDLKPGDLVFFSSTPSQSYVGHAGIYIGGGEFIHAASGSKNKVVISKLSEPYYVKTYKCARRVL